MGIIIAIFQVFIYILTGIVFLVVKIVDCFKSNKSNNNPTPASSQDETLFPKRTLYINHNALYKIPTQQPLDKIVLTDESATTTNWALDTREQRLRFLRAKKYTPTEINREKKLARYRSQHEFDKTYITSLVGCSCPDFNNRNRPCKHMYALAFEFDVMSKDAPLFNLPADIEETIANLDVSQVHSHYNLHKIIEMALELKEYDDIQTEGGVYRVMHIHTDVMSMNRLRPLLNAGILILAPKTDFDFCDFVAEHFTVEQFKASAKNICPVIKFPSLRKRELIEYICSNNPDIAKAIDKLYSHVAIDYRYLDNGDLIKDYLDDVYLHPLSDYVEYQKNYS